MPSSCGAQIVARTVQDLALPSLPSKNNYSGSSLQIASNPWSFQSPGAASCLTSPPPSALSGASQRSPARACGCFSPPHGGALARHCLPALPAAGPGLRTRRDAQAASGSGAEILSPPCWPQLLKFGALRHPAAHTSLTVIPDGDGPWLYPGSGVHSNLGLLCFPVPKPLLDWLTRGAGTCPSQKPSSTYLGAPSPQPRGSLPGLGVRTPRPSYPLLSLCRAPVQSWDPESPELASSVVLGWTMRSRLTGKEESWLLVQEYPLSMPVTWITFLSATSCTQIVTPPTNSSNCGSGSALPRRRPSVWAIPEARASPGEKQRAQRCALHSQTQAPLCPCLVSPTGRTRAIGVDRPGTGNLLWGFQREVWEQ